MGLTKVQRYWAGKAPEWAKVDDEEEGDTRIGAVALGEPLEVSNIKDDPRLRRLAKNRIDPHRQRIRHRAEIVSTEEGTDSEEEDEDAFEEKRRINKEKGLLLLQEEEEEEELEEEESESEEEEELMGLTMAKPILVPKSERETIAERERIKAEEQALEELEKRRLEERKIETKNILVEEIRKDEQIQKNLETETGNTEDVDTDDEVNEAEEYEAWKARELARIKSERENREKKEIKPVGNKTEEENWERLNPKPAPPPKRKRNFLARDFHKGAFFRSEADNGSGGGGAATDEIFNRDLSEPTGEDKMDKSRLPSVMQVKNFGRRGRTKWTHLVKEDTTDWTNPWMYNGPFRVKYNAKINAPIEKPRGSKKLKAALCF